VAEARSDFYLFPLLTEHLRGSDNDVIKCVENFLQGQDELFYKNGIQKMQEEWNKCIEVR